MTSPRFIRTAPKQETRIKLCVPVRLIRSGYKAEEITAELIDISIHGCKVKHRRNDILTGEQFQVIYPWGEVRARVVWTRINGTWVETGFYVG